MPNSSGASAGSSSWPPAMPGWRTSKPFGAKRSSKKNRELPGVVPAPHRARQQPPGVADQPLRRVFPAEKITKIDEIEKLGHAAPVGRQGAAALPERRGEALLEHRVLSGIPAQQDADIEQRRPGMAELPVEDGGNAPAGSVARHQDVGLAKV